MRGRHLIRRPVLVAAAAAAALAVPAGAAAAPTGLFEGNYAQTGNTINEYTIGSSGLLSSFGHVATGGESWLLAASPNGKYLYGSDYYDGTVSQYRIDGATLTPLSPAAVPSGSEPTQLAVSPDGKNLYVANRGTDTLSVFDIEAGGALSPAGGVTADLLGPSGVAVSRDGKSVYVANYSGSIIEFNRNSAGALVAKSPAIIPTGLSQDINLVMTPNGKYLYASGSGTTSIDEFAVGSGGQLSALSTTATEGTQNFELSVSPNGKNLYAASCENSAPGIYQYSIAGNGQLAALSPAVVATADNCSYDQWMTANGSALYAPGSPSGNGHVAQFSVSASGALSPKSPFEVPAGFEPDDVMIAPDQGPVAKFSVKAGRAGKATKFNASKSHDSDGKVVRYIWSFGHHKTKTTRRPKLSYKFKKAGRYRVTLTVVDDSGCSTTQVFTGQTAYCNGTKAAKISHRVKVKKRKKS